MKGELGVVVASGSFVMAATVRHPGFESRSCQFFSFLSEQVGFQLNFNNVCIFCFTAVYA